jgi:hypothetical protein
MDEWMGWKDGWEDECMDGWDRWMNEWTNELND